MSGRLEHLVLVRHVEGEGDRRRAAWRRGETARTTKMPEHEVITPEGERCAPIIGRWIVKNILERHGLPGFDGYFVSTALRSLQSAVALGLADAVWQADEQLDERNRGQVRGLHPEVHRQRFPNSYRQMKEDPVHWVPPGGNAIVPHLVDKFTAFYDDIRDMRSVIIVGHRDQFWAAMKPLEILSDSELAAVDTDLIVNGYVTHYARSNPQTGQLAPALMWKFSVDPLQPEGSTGWEVLPNVAKRYDLAA